MFSEAERDCKVSSTTISFPRLNPQTCKTKADAGKGLSQLVTWETMKAGLVNSRSGSLSTTISQTGKWNQTHFVPVDHSAHSIGELFKTMLEDQQGKPDLHDHGQRKQIWWKLFGGFSNLWFECFGHLKGCRNSVTAVINLVQGFSWSWKRRRELRGKQAALNMPLKAWSMVWWHHGDQASPNMHEYFLSQLLPIDATLARERETWHLAHKDKCCRETLPDALASERQVILLQPSNLAILAEKDK